MKGTHIVVVATVLVAAGVSHFVLDRHTTVIDWPSSLPSAEVVSQSLGAVIGERTRLLAGCGPQRILVTYVDAPIDILPEIQKGRDGHPVWVHSMAQEGRYLVASTVASAAWSVITRDNAIDTITVQLERRGHRPSNFGPDRGQFTLVRGPEPAHSPLPHIVWSDVKPCTQGPQS